MRLAPSPERRTTAEIDDVTLARAARGDEGAWCRLVEQYERLVWAYVWRMLRPHATEAAVEDLFQETFLGVHRGLGGFTAAGPARLSTWILAIATRVTLNHLRRLRRETGREADEGDSDRGAAAARIEHGALLPALLRGLAALTAEHRAIVLLRDYHELDYDEIATALDVDVGTVASRLHRARQRLRTHLGQEDR